MNHVITKLKLDEALSASVDGLHVVMIDMDVFNSIHEIRYMTIEEIVNLDNSHDVIFLLIE